MFLLIGVLSGLSNLDPQQCANTLEATQPHTLSQLRGQQLPSLQGVALDDGVLGNALIQKLGSAFRQWCRSKRIPIPPCTWNLHLVGRGETDEKGYPELESNVKAVHTKIILFFLCDLARDVSTLCQ